MRGDTLTAKHAAATHCPQGHPYDATNTYIDPSGWRKCRSCMAENVKRGYRGTGRRKTHCKNGHEYTAENSYISPRGARNCRECDRTRRRNKGGQ